jgi:hypothetical protein
MTYPAQSCKSSTNFSRNESEAIVELGAEGGSITLSGFRTERGWSFWREVTDWSPELIDEERIQHESAVVGSWEAALKILDGYDWWRLSPIRIHPAFKQKIWVAVQKRLRSATGISQRELENWHELCLADTYITDLQRNFSKYRDNRFAGLRDLFEIHKGGAVVFRPGQVENNLLVPPWCTANEREQIIRKILPSKRHKHFGSMRSSQALAQSVFGTIEVLNKLSLLSGVKSEDGRSAFGPMVSQAKLDFEKEMKTLGELKGHKTSIDVWFEAHYRVAVECKLSEGYFGTCSRPRLKSHNPEYCDGTYTLQGDRTDRCSLTTLGVHYWKYTAELFGWSSETDHHPECPLASTYQLVRNTLAACVNEVGGPLDLQRGHALIIYDARNPSMVSGGEGDRQWRKASDALRVPGLLRRLSWQAFISQWPNDRVLGWLKQELLAKYGLST